MGEPVVPLGEPRALPLAEGCRRGAEVKQCGKGWVAKVPGRSYCPIVLVVVLCDVTSGGSEVDVPDQAAPTGVGDGDGGGRIVIVVDGE